MEEKKKKSNGPLIIIIVLIIVILGLVGYICYEKGIIFNNESKQVEDKASVSGSNDKVEDKADIKNRLITFDKNNCINYDLSKDIVSKSGSSFNGVTLSINSENEKVIDVQISYVTMHPEKYSNADIQNNSIKTYDKNSLNFDKKVEDIFVGNFAADGVQGAVFIFLLDDGSLEYMKYSDIYFDNKLEHKPVSGVSDIVKFGNHYVRAQNQEVGGKYTTFAYKIDGTFYDLSEFIKVY